MKLSAAVYLNNPERVSGIDCFRGLAILTVVVYHFNNQLFPAGMIGVDLFFVISGLLIGGLLTRRFDRGQPVSFFRFFLQRGFKIWPSFYFFMLAGSGMAWLLYRTSHPDFIIPLWDFKRYLFFYQNYTGQPFHHTFDQVWSLCVEEHFYVMLPLLFIFIQRFIPSQYQRVSLYGFTIATILMGIAFKFCSFYFTNSKDTYSGTHNRIDALAWGVLLNLLISHHGAWLKTKVIKTTSLITGAVVLTVAIYVYQHSEILLFNEVLFHSITSFAFFLLLQGAYFINFTKFKALRFIAYYSYNWYLWHPLLAPAIKDWLGLSVQSFAVYLVISFGIAMLTTIVVEEPCLKWRHRVINSLFKDRPVPVVQY